MVPKAFPYESLGGSSAPPKFETTSRGRGTCSNQHPCWFSPLEVAKDWHRRALWVHPFKSRAEWDERIDAMHQGAYIIPHAESLGSVETLEETMNLPDLKMFFFGMTDLSKVIGGTKKPNWDDPKLWAFVDRAVKIGKEKNIVIGANTSYAYTMAEMRQRVKRLKDAGMGFIMIQGAPFLFQVAMTEFLKGVREDLGLA